MGTCSEPECQRCRHKDADKVRGEQQEGLREKVRVSQAQTRISELDEEERQLGNLLAELERARLEAERVAGTSSTSTLRTSDLGSLNWPVQGTVAYRFGEAKPDVDDVRETPAAEAAFLEQGGYGAMVEDLKEQPGSASVVQGITEFLPISSSASRTASCVASVGMA